MRNLRRLGVVCAVLLFGVWPGPETCAREAARNSGLPSFNRAAIANLTATIAGRIAASGCKDFGCTVVVADFTFKDGETSRFGERLAREISNELADAKYNLKVTDRQILQNFLDDQRLYLNDRATVRWVLQQLETRFMVLGTTETAKDGTVSLSGQLVDERDKKYVLYEEKIDAGTPDSTKDLAPIGTLTPLPPLELLFEDKNGRAFTIADVTLPTCSYRPNPYYSVAAHKEKVTGTIKVEVIIDTDGHFEGLRVVQGMPFGLNERTLAAMRTWKCSP